MPMQISLADFNRIASGSYNAGQIDIRTSKKGVAELVKINNHVWRTSKNTVELAPERILEVKEAFIAALTAGGVKPEDIVAIRRELGITYELDAGKDGASVEGLVKDRFTPLSREKVRDILDRYAAGGRGFTQESIAAVSAKEAKAAQRAAGASEKTVAKRDAVNTTAPSGYDPAEGQSLSDAVALLSTTTSLKQLDAARGKRFTGDSAAQDREFASAALRQSFTEVFSQAIKLLPAGIRESDEFKCCGTTVKLVKDDNGEISAVLGKEPSATTVKLGFDAQSFLDRLVGRAINGEEMLGAPTMKTLLNKVYDHDLEGGLTISDRTSLTRHFAALILENKSEGAWGQLVGGNYNTGLLVEIAERALDGTAPVDTKEQLDAYHAQLVRDNAGLPQEMKDMLEQVLTIPFEKPDFGSGEFVVRAPIVGKMDPLVGAIPPPPARPPVVPRDIGGLEGIKQIIADLVFSDETMVADVKVKRPGETMRDILSDDKKIIALAEIIKNPDLIDAAAAPQIAGALKEGFGKMIAVLDAAFKNANGGESLAEAAKKQDFVGRLSLFIWDADQLPGPELAKFDGIIQAMANKGCEELQAFVNQVFQVDVTSANEIGAVTTDPYKGLSPAQIKSELVGKSLNQILDAASTSDAPGQVGFFKQIISSYYTQLAKADKRSAFAAALRYAPTFDFSGKQGEDLESAKKAAIATFTGAVLKGAGPLLQKMMQGLPKELMGEFAEALADMKSNLAPIPRKVVQAHLMKLIQDSHGKIQAIELKKSLGAASVGEAFLCTFSYIESRQKEEPYEDPETKRTKMRKVVDESGKPVMEDVSVTRDCVVKIMRHDAEKRVTAEAEIFTAAAAKIPGMSKTWEGQYKQYMTEFDFTNEARNVDKGVALYDIADSKDHPLKIVAPQVKSMKMSELVPKGERKKDVMVAEVASGTTVDKFFQTSVREIRAAAAPVFERDPATGRILWQDGPIDLVTKKPTKVPVLRENAPVFARINLQLWFAGKYDDLQKTSRLIQQATKAWFHEALLGSGQFHGDAHAGNFMVTGSSITFIDFGNLYTLDAQRADGVNEKTELLRVIMGAAFRDKKFVLQGFEKLMSPEGRAALAANRAKAEAILDAVLSKGGFSFNIVYRLQAAVVELQKLGLELPPQINCFIQSLVRLSNTVTEINTIMNQCKAMLDTTQAIGPAVGGRDPLDLAGQAFDVFAQAAKETDPKKRSVKIAAALDEMTSERFGGFSPHMHPDFEAKGAYTEKIVTRLEQADDVMAEAERLIGLIAQHTDRTEDVPFNVLLENLDRFMKDFREGYGHAETPEAKKAAIETFAVRFANIEGQAIAMMSGVAKQVSDITFRPPKSFATAITDVLFDNFDALKDGLTGDEQTAFMLDASGIAKNEFGLSLFQLFNPERVEQAFREDAQKMGGDTDYKIDIGV